MPNSKKKSQWEAPKGFRKTVTLSSGKAEAKVSHGLDTVDVKVKVFGRYYRGVDGTGPIHKVKVKVPSTSLRVKLANGTVYKVRSCCKPPDVYNKYAGIHIALHRLRDILKQNKISGEDQRLIIEAFCPSLFRKMNKKTADATHKVAAALRKVTVVQSNTAATLSEGD
jgi:hypothetical protein